MDYNQKKGDDMDENENDIMQEINENLKAIKGSVKTIATIMVLTVLLGLLFGACSFIFA